MKEERRGGGRRREEGRAKVVLVPKTCMTTCESMQKLSEREDIVRIRMEVEDEEERKREFLTCKTDDDGNPFSHSHLTTNAKERETSSLHPLSDPFLSTHPTPFICKFSTMDM